MACKNRKYVGRSVVLEYALGCGSDDPGALNFKVIGAMRTKEFSIEWDTTDATADDSVGSLRENLATFLGLTISGDGTCLNDGAAAKDLNDLVKYVINPVGGGGQPVAWLRMTFPDLTFTAFCIVTTVSRSAPYDDVVTYSLEASATSSDVGLLVEDTVAPSPVAPTGVTVVPSSITLAKDASYDLVAVVLPTNAHQGVTWSSSNAAKATVNKYTGLVTAMDSTGTATITATSTADGAKSSSCTVTLSA